MHISLPNLSALFLFHVSLPDIYSRSLFRMCRPTVAPQALFRIYLPNLSLNSCAQFLFHTSSPKFSSQISSTFLSGFPIIIDLSLLSSETILLDICIMDLLNFSFGFIFRIHLPKWSSEFIFRIGLPNLSAQDPRPSCQGPADLVDFLVVKVLIFQEHPHYDPCVSPHRFWI